MPRSVLLHRLYLFAYTDLLHCPALLRSSKCFGWVNSSSTYIPGLFMHRVFWICPTFIKSFHTASFFCCCLARPIGCIENADIWMERPEALENARGIQQISFLSGRDNWDLIPLGQQMEVVKTEPLNGMNLWVKGLGAVPCKQFCFFPAC